MMSQTNRFPGVNPHINSALQQPKGDWKSFHAYHIIDLADALDEVLPLGYTVKPEDSLQVSVYDIGEGDAHHFSRADVLISQTSAPYSPSTATLEQAPTLIAPIARLIEDSDDITALVIYQGAEPITRIELLSPANKLGGLHYHDYRLNRYDTLKAGLRLVEIDYLHERHPVSRELPSYKAQQDGAYPYYILVHDPRPSYEEGEVRVYGVGILDPLPVIGIPLQGEDRVALDIGAVYQRTIQRRVFQEMARYNQEPSHFGAYTLADQTAIRDWMSRITTA